MESTSNFAITAALMGDPVRAQMLAALMDGRALTSSELARGAGVTPQTASGHLFKLADGGLVSVIRQGRCRYYKIASRSVAQAIEHLGSLSGELASNRQKSRPLRVGPRDPQLRLVRTCYDHLAGSVAVRMVDSLTERGFLEMSFEGALLARSGVEFLSRLGVELDGARTRSSHVFCRPCLDWSERRPHLAGEVGAALCRTCFEKGWMRRPTKGRAITLTPAGRRAIDEAFPVMTDRDDVRRPAGEGDAGHSAKQPARCDPVHSLPAPR